VHGSVLVGIEDLLTHFHRSRRCFLTLQTKNVTMIRLLMLALYDQDKTIAAPLSTTNINLPSLHLILVLLIVNKEDEIIVKKYKEQTMVLLSTNKNKVMLRIIPQQTQQQDAFFLHMWKI
jgi:hypothetical protein